MKRLFSVLMIIACMKAHLEEKKITVVGAGLAGLTAAYRIEQLTNIPVDIYEARSRPGGRVFTVNIGDTYEELGGKFLGDGGEAFHIKSLIQEMGLEEEIIETDLSQRKYTYRGATDFFYNAILNNLPNGLPTREEFELYCKKAKSLGEVLDSIFEGKEILRNIAELHARNYDGNDSKDLSVAYSESNWEFYESEYDSAKGDKTYSYVPMCVKGGNSRLVQELAGSLKGQIHYESPLRKISRTKDGQFCLGFKDKQVLTDYLIIAIPCSTLRDVEIEPGILPADQQKAIDTLQYGTNAKILLPIAIKKEDAAYFSVTDDMVVWFNKDNSVMTLYSGGKRGLFDTHSLKSVSDQIASQLPALQKLFPSLTFPKGLGPTNLQEKLYATYSQPIALSWVHEEFSKGSYSSWGVDQFDFFNEKEEHFAETVRKVFRPVNGKIFFAGEHTTLEYVGTLEGAVESGERIARMVSNSLK